MKSKLLSAAALLAATALTAPAQARDAQMTVIHQTGSWFTSVGYSNAGDAMCTVGMTGPLSVEKVGSGVWLKWDVHTPHMVAMHIWKGSWHLPQMSLRVRLQVDNAPARIYNARVVGGELVEIDIGLDDIDPVTGEPVGKLLSNLMRSGLRLTVTFPDYPGEMGWNTPLNGASVELGQFAQCMVNLGTGIDNGEIAANNRGGNGNGPALPHQQAPQQLPTTQATPSYRPL